MARDRGPDPDEFAAALAEGMRHGGASEAEIRRESQKAYAERQTKPADQGWRLQRKN